MVRIEDTVWCEGCGVEIVWTPVVIKNHHYCCMDCAKGRQCDCASMGELEEERRGGGAQGTVAARYEG